ncbi:hypothetical protein HLH33_15490 [Gluconacetobacter diazotrophicus]|uniref:Uncharacterized protein n=1 Tax=Gluconacetobacter diazotrophicus TaxID=33996 RepID=A0A7W4I7H9_GLUDI|nr:hypothetical protein [Gluconacetobacter diazotrophicus]MBB2157697.1 hypothetical protein [Gluconacetobacter diazotrophicus]
MSATAISFDVSHSRHAVRRQQERATLPLFEALLLDYGTRKRTQGPRSFSSTRRLAGDLARLWGESAAYVPLSVISTSNSSSVTRDASSQRGIVPGASIAPDTGFKIIPLI